MFFWNSLAFSMKLSHAVWGHPRWVGHGGEVWQNVVHWRREWQTTSVFLPWEPILLGCHKELALGSLHHIANSPGHLFYTSGGDGIPVELFQILKDDTVKVLHSIMPTNLENSAVATGLEKVSFHSNPKERQCQRMLKLLHNCTHLTC